MKSPRNKTLVVSSEDIVLYSSKLKTVQNDALETDLSFYKNTTINQGIFELLQILKPTTCIDLLFIDPPYNLDKKFNSNTFKKTTDALYEVWFEGLMFLLVPFLKKDASVYVCCDWRSTAVIYNVLSKHLIVRNRITWEREKGRGAKSNWKNCSEDIWFATVSNDYYFNPNVVKLKKKVIAPYKKDGKPKDWENEADGNFRLTFPSNLWTDITIPFWSMPENTEHSTQKPEKLLAKVVLASSEPGDLVFDPFLGSGTTSVVSKKLDRNYVGVELDKTYCLLAEKRLALAEKDKSIQGYDGVFWERNSK